MRILLISDLTQGGAAIGARRLYRALQGTGKMQVTWIAAEGVSDREVTVAEKWPALGALIRYRCALKLGGSGAVARAGLNEVNVSRFVHRARPDLICLQNIHQSMSFGLLRRLPVNIPVVWVLRDMWALTGYCCYSMDCDAYADGCSGPCSPEDKWGPRMGVPAEEWARRDRFFAANAHRVCLVAPSNWLAECAVRRFGERLRVEWIPHGLDVQVFRPVPDRRALRRALELPEDGKLVLAGAYSVKDDRKGMSLLMDAIRSLRTEFDSPVLLLTFGHGGQVGEGTEHRHVGMLTDPKLLRLYYAAADVFVLPSLAEAFGHVLVESLACGTPCVAFRTGGALDIVRPGENGYLAQVGNTSDLATCISRVLRLGEEQMRDMRRASRNVAKTDYDLGSQGRRYAALFERLLNERVT